MAPSYARPTLGCSKTSRKACGYRSTSLMTEHRETRSTASRLSEPIRSRWTSARPRATDLHPTPRRLVGGPSPFRAGIWRLPRFCPHMTGWKVKIRNALLIVTIELLAATLSLALPNLAVEIARSEELGQTQTLKRPQTPPIAPP